MVLTPNPVRVCQWKQQRAAGVSFPSPAIREFLWGLGNAGAGGDFEHLSQHPPRKTGVPGFTSVLPDIGATKVITIFVATPIGHHNRKPQLWLTMAIGDSDWNERRYTSHRAALNAIPFNEL